MKTYDLLTAKESQAQAQALTVTKTELQIILFLKTALCTAD